MEGESLDLDGNNYPNTNNNEKIIKEQITYALPEKMNAVDLLATKEHTNLNKTYHSITKKYRYTMPWNTRYQMQKTLTKNNAKEGLVKN